MSLQCTRDARGGTLLKKPHAGAMRGGEGGFSTLSNSIARGGHKRDYRAGGAGDRRGDVLWEHPPLPRFHFLRRPAHPDSVSPVVSVGLPTSRALRLCFQGRSSEFPPCHPAAPGGRWVRHHDRQEEQEVSRAGECRPHPLHGPHAGENANLHVFYSRSRRRTPRRA